MSVLSTLRLWLHEVSRTFGDRLMGPEERLWLEAEKTEIVTRKLCFSGPPAGNAQGASRGSPLLWGDWFITGQKTYREAPPKQQLLKLLHAVNEETSSRKQLQDGVGESPAPPQIVFFSETIEHLAALCRVLRYPQGHALLLGFGATGKQTVARLAACIRDFDLVRKDKGNGRHWAADRDRDRGRGRGSHRATDGE